MRSCIVCEERKEGERGEVEALNIERGEGRDCGAAGPTEPRHRRVLVVASDQRLQENSPSTLPLPLPPIISSLLYIVERNLLLTHLLSVERPGPDPPHCSHSRSILRKRIHTYCTTSSTSPIGSSPRLFCRHPGSHIACEALRQSVEERAPDRFASLSGR